MKKILGILLLIFSVIILLIGNKSITGYSISENTNFSFFNLLGILLFFISILLLGSRKTLDYLVIPGGKTKWREDRISKMREVKKKREVKKTYVMRGRDSEEDILILGEKLKGGERVGFDTFPLHYREYIEIIKKAQRDGKFPKNVKTENLATKQGLTEYIYGLLGWGEEIIKRREVDYMENRKGKYLPKIKNFVKKLLGI